MANYFGQLILTMALEDRHFIAEQNDILFAFFGCVVQKLFKFKVHLCFLSFIQFPEMGRNRFVPGLD